MTIPARAFGASFPEVIFKGRRLLCVGVPEQHIAVAATGNQFLGLTIKKTAIDVVKVPGQGSQTFSLHHVQENHSVCHWQEKKIGMPKRLISLKIYMAENLIERAPQL